jgi:putative hydrolase of the HAD superfamily
MSVSVGNLAAIDTWLFDLDNTLYPASCNLFGQIDQRMGAFIADLLKLDLVEARRVQKSFFRDHGTTLAGLMAEHGTDPRLFLDYVHDIALDVLVEDRRLVKLLAALPGRKLIFTNGDTAYASRVLAKLGLADSFAAIYDICAADYRPKPDPVTYRGLLDRFDINPATALFADDMARNLTPAKALGMTTVWVNNGSDDGDHDHLAEQIDIEITDVADWLETLLGKTI